MAAGLTTKLMDMSDVARLIDDAEMRATIQQRATALAFATIKLRYDHVPRLIAKYRAVRARAVNDMTICRNAVAAM